MICFGRSKHDWLSTFLTLPHGIPSHDTYSQVFALLDPEVLEHCFSRWVQSLAARLPGEVVVINGKTARRSYDRWLGVPALHMVSAWAAEAQLVLGRRKTDAQSNERVAPVAVRAAMDQLQRRVCRRALRPLARQQLPDRGDHHPGNDPDRHLHPAYAFARFDFHGRDLWFILMLSTMMIPRVVTFIPQYLLFFKIGLINTYIPLTIGACRILFSIITPLMKPALTTVAILTFLGDWNDFFGSFICLNKPVLFTAAVGLRTFQYIPLETTDPRDHLLMAAAAIMTIPMIVLFIGAQRYLISGVVLTGLKI